MFERLQKHQSLPCTYICAALQWAALAEKLSRQKDIMNHTSNCGLHLLQCTKPVYFCFIRWFEVPHESNYLFLLATERSNSAFPITAPTCLISFNSCCMRQDGIGGWAEELMRSWEEKKEVYIHCFLGIIAVAYIVCFPGWALCSFIASPLGFFSPDLMVPLKKKKKNERCFNNY